MKHRIQSHHSRVHYFQSPSFVRQQQNQDSGLFSEKIFGIQKYLQKISTKIFGLQKYNSFY